MIMIPQNLVSHTAIYTIAFISHPSLVAHAKQELVMCGH